MPPILETIFPYPIFAALLGILIWAFLRWWRSTPRIGVPAWRSYTAIGAFCVSVLSFLLWLTLFAWAHAIGGFPFYDPVVMCFYALGFLTGVLGMVLSLIGKGKLCGPSFSFVAIMTLLWVLAASGE